MWEGLGKLPRFGGKNLQGCFFVVESLLQVPAAFGNPEKYDLSYLGMVLDDK